MKKLKKVIEEIEYYKNEKYTLLELSNILQKITNDDIFNYDVELNIFDDRAKNIVLNLGEDQKVLITFDIMKKEEDLKNSIVKIVSIDEI